MARFGYPFPYGITVYVQHPKIEVDPFSGEEERLNWLEATEERHDNCAIAPRAPDEGREPLMSGRSPVYIATYIIGPYDMNVNARSRVRVDDEVFEVEGDPVKWRSPLTGSVLGTQVNLLRMEG